MEEGFGRTDETHIDQFVFERLLFDRLFDLCEKEIEAAYGENYSGKTKNIRYSECLLLSKKKTIWKSNFEVLPGLTPTLKGIQ